FTDETHRFARTDGEIDVINCPHALASGRGSPVSLVVDDDVPELEDAHAVLGAGGAAVGAMVPRRALAARRSLGYRCRGRESTPSALPDSTRRPRYMTDTRSHTARTTWRSWLMSRSPMLCSLTRDLRSRRI